MRRFKNYSRRRQIREGSEKWFVRVPKKSIQVLLNWAKLPTEVCGVVAGRKVGKQSFEVVELILDEDSLTNTDPLGVTRLTKNILPSLDNLVRHHENCDWIGEWHTHPACSLYPSHLDIATMTSLIGDPEYGSPEEVILFIAGRDYIDSWVFLRGDQGTLFAKAMTLN